MRKLAIPALVLLICLPLAAQTVEQIALSRATKISTFLQPAAKYKLDLVSRLLIAHMVSVPSDADYLSFVRSKVRNQFPNAATDQSNLLGFYVLTETYRVLKDPMKLNNILASMNVKGYPQNPPDQKTIHLLDVLGTVLKNLSEVQDSIVRTLA